MKWLRMAAGAAWLIGNLGAQRVGAPTDDLTKLGVDELFSIEVTSVGRKAQGLSKAPAAVFVLTAEDIRRSGATSVPEALRWVPGLTVLSQDGRSWSISARGSTRLYSDKILVMIDGRSLYTPLFSGVIWDAVDVPLGDVEQIEIVRGPGAVMWGPNAVNGVINIITRRAQSTTGQQVSLATGNDLRASAEARTGKAWDRMAYRVWGKYDFRTPGYGSFGDFSFTNFVFRDPAIRNLDMGSGRIGFRVDGQPDEKDQWMVQGDVYKADRQDPLAFPTIRPAVERLQGHTDYEGGFIQGRWIHTASPGNESEFRWSYDHNDFDYSYVAASLQNVTADLQNRLHAGEGNEIYWGAGFQQYWDDTRSQRLVAFDPAKSLYRSGYGVLRDEWQLVPDRFLCSAGIRVDYNSYHQLEYQPSLRFLYTPNARQSAWAAVSRAIRAPNRLDRSLEYDPGYRADYDFPIRMHSTGSQAQLSEVARSAESGYRFQAGQRWSIDASLFFTYFERLRALTYSNVPEISISNGVLAISTVLATGNLGRGRSYGGEFWGMWQVRPGWRLAPSYSYVRDTFWLPPSSPVRMYNWDLIPMDLRHQALLRSQFDIGRQWQVDLMARARSRERAWGLPAAFLVDARAAWRCTRNSEVSIALTNLTDRRVIEASSESATPAIPIRRTFLLKWSQRF
uniref:TonB-dependent receptor n=1 Tax=Solibacter usitatus (strain Ellin6076) TaxID=234267 RepID=Q02A72_SOLUE